MNIITPMENQFLWYRTVIKPIFNGYTVDGVGPHGSTLRASSTIGASYRGFLKSIQLHCVRDDVASGVGRVKVSCIVTVGASNNVMAEIEMVSNTQWDSRLLVMTPDILLDAGSTVGLYTSDNSVGGSIDYYLAFCLNTFPS